MQLLMASTSYPRDRADWRGVFIRHLVDAFAHADDVQLHLLAPPGEVPSNVEIVANAAESAWLARLMLAGGISHLLRGGELASLLAPLALLRLLSRAYRRERGVDAYHINWLQCALPLPDNGIPAVIGVLGNDLKLLRLPLMRALLRRIMRRRRVAICPNSEWMRAPLQAAFGDLAEVVPISFGIDARWYTIARTPQRPARWLAVTRLTKDKLGPLFEWSAPLFNDARARELHLFGPMQESITVPDWVHYHGPADADMLASEWFPSASGLVTLSKHAEGRPQIMLEAMAAGLPIIASRMPAHNGVVRDGVTGLLCDTREAFARAITRTEDPHTNADFGAAARAAARVEYGTWDDCAARYLVVHRRLQTRKANA